MNKLNNYVVIDLFSGAGGLGTGLHQAGFQVALAIDNDQVACETYKLNHPKTTVWCKDIRQVTGDHIREIIGDKKIILAGGSPCQDFSMFQEEYGGKTGIHTDRGKLIFEYLRIAKELQPDYIIYENVSYLVKKHKQGFNSFLTQLKEATGLHFEWKVLNALNFGVAQRRERLILLGSRTNETPFVYLQEVKGPKTLREAFVDVPPSPYATFSPQQLQIMKQIGEGEYWKVLPTHVAMKALGKDYRAICIPCGTAYKPQWQPRCPKCGSNQFKNGYGVTSYFRRLAWDKPSYTVCSVLPTKSHGTLAHPAEDRGLTVRECARLQGFADDYTFLGTLADQYRQIGNSVPVTLAKAIGEAIRHSISRNIDYMGYLEALKKHPNKDKLTLLERDFLNNLYLTLKQRREREIPERWSLYLKETLQRIS